jgi:hypothetical protein
MQSIPGHQLKVAYQNEQAAELCRSSRLYNAACSRYYYSVYQYLILIYREVESQVNIPSTASHVFTIDKITGDIASRFRSKEKAINLNKDFHLLKKIRTQADYGQVLLDEELSIRARTLAKRIILGLKTVYPLN